MFSEAAPPTKKNLLLITLAIYLSIFLIGWLDFITGPDVGFSIFYLIPISAAAWFLGRIHAIFLSVLCALVWRHMDILGNHPYSNVLISYWNALIRLFYFLITTFFIDFVHRQIILKTQQQLQITKEQLQQLTTHLQIVREHERENLSRMIHDEFGHELTSLKLDLSWIERKLPSLPSQNVQEIMQRLEGMKKLVDCMVNLVRQIATELRPSILDHLGLAEAIEWQAREFEKRNLIRCDLQLDPIPNLNPDRSIAIFRIFQEALSNISRHADATHVEIHLKKDKNNLRLKIKDNGRGIQNSELARTDALGIIGMRERATFLQGQISIEGSPGKGTALILEVPVENEGLS